MRRTLSPVPRPGTPLGGESTSFTVAVASPLSKCSSCNTPSTDPSYFASKQHYLYRFVLNLFSKTSSRSLEKQKPKSNSLSWRRSFFHFLVGVFIGFTPIVSIRTSTSVVSRSQAFTFEQVEKVQLYDVNVNHVMSTNILNDSKPQKIDVKQENETIETGVGKFLIIVTTITRSRFYLSRLAHTLKLVEPPLLWVVVEMTSQSLETSELLRGSGVMYRHLVCTINTTEVKDPRVHQRNAALKHIETHRLDGIVYLADDNNIFSTQLFHHIRKITRFETWQVAKLKESTRVVTFVGPICNGTQVIGWHTNNVMRRFHADLSGFAFNSSILWDPKQSTRPIRHLDTVKDLFQASTFIEQVVEGEAEMEGIPEDCSEVLVWNLSMKSINYRRPMLLFLISFEYQYQCDVTARLLFKVSTSKLENIEEEEGAVPMACRLPETPTESMEFLGRSWSVSSVEISKALSHNYLQPKNANLFCSGENEPQPSAKANSPPRKSDELKELFLIHHALNQDFVSSHQLLKNGLYRNIMRGRTMGRWIKDQKERRKHEVRTHIAQLHAAVSVAGVAAAVAALTATSATSTNGNNKEERGCSKTSNAIASAAALVASHCIEIAEDMGAEHEQILSAINSATTARTNGDIMTLTAGAATALRGAATLRARLQKGAATMALGEEQGEEGKEYSNVLAALNFVSKGGQLLKLTRKGDLHWKQVSFKVNTKWQVVAKLKSKHIAGTFTKKKKYVVSGVYVEWLGRETDEEKQYFGIETSERIIQFECTTKEEKHKWIEGLQLLLNCRANMARST